MFPEELKELNIYKPEKETEILEVLKDFFVVTSIGIGNPKPGIYCCSICKHDDANSFVGSTTLYTDRLIPLNCRHYDYNDAIYLAHKDFSTNKSSEVDSILNRSVECKDSENKFKYKDGFHIPYIPGLYPPYTENRPASQSDTKKIKPALNLDQSLQNYLIAEDLLKKMFLRNPQKTLRVLKKIYLPIMIEAKMLELAQSTEDLKILKDAFKKVQSKRYRPDLRTDIFAKMRAASEETGASYDKLKTLNATKGGLSKAAKRKFAEK